MRKTLREIEQEYSIPTATLRAAIHRGTLRAEKAGGIRLIDDESDSFQTYVADYRGDRARKYRKGRTRVTI